MGCWPDHQGRAQLSGCSQIRNKRLPLVVKFSCSLGHGPGTGVPHCHGSGNLLETKYSLNFLIFSFRFAQAGVHS